MKLDICSVIIICFSIIAFTSISSIEKTYRLRTIEIQRMHVLQTPEQIQQELTYRGYNIEVDGVMGKSTIDAWDAEIKKEEMKKLFDKEVKSNIRK